jgi:mannose-6-phosphate isomerase-like protein (cupin superfamily)
MSDTPEPRGFVLLPGEGRSIDLKAFRMTVKADHAATGGAFALLEAEEPPGFGPPLHIHRDAAEAFYVIAGDYIMLLEGEEVACPTGSFIFIPAGVLHGFRVGSMVSRKLNLYTPAAMVGYFDGLSEAIRSGDVDDASRAAIATKYSMEVFGPSAQGYTR